MRDWDSPHPLETACKPSRSIRRYSARSSSALSSRRPADNTFLRGFDGRDSSHSTSCSIRSRACLSVRTTDMTNNFRMLPSYRSGPSVTGVRNLSKDYKSRCLVPTLGVFFVHTPSCHSSISSHIYHARQVPRYGCLYWSPGTWQDRLRLLHRLRLHRRCSHYQEWRACWYLPVGVSIWPRQFSLKVADCFGTALQSYSWRHEKRRYLDQL